MLHHIDYTNTAVIYCHSTLITKVMLLYNTEWQYDHGMAVDYCGKKFYNLGPGCNYEKKLDYSKKKVLLYWFFWSDCFGSKL